MRRGVYVGLILLGIFVAAACRGRDEFERACEPCSDEDTCVIHLNAVGDVHSAECEQTSLECTGEACPSGCASELCDDNAFCEAACGQHPAAFICCYP